MAPSGPGFLASPTRMGHRTGPGLTTFADASPRPVQRPARPRRPSACPTASGRAAPPPRRRRPAS
eukprot:219019-Alexandrium_andersonii.AAC.1